MGLEFRLGLVPEEANIFPSSYPPIFLCKFLCAREFRNNQPILTCSRFQNGSDASNWGGFISLSLLCLKSVNPRVSGCHLFYRRSRTFSEVSRTFSNSKFKFYF
jgi:hypothetical protein